jgi:hypothetical protein
LATDVGSLEHTTWTIPPDAPINIVEAFRKAPEHTAGGPGYRSPFEKVDLMVPLMHGRTGKKISTLLPHGSQLCGVDEGRFNVKNAS